MKQLRFIFWNLDSDGIRWSLEDLFCGQGTHGVKSFGVSGDQSLALVESTHCLMIYNGKGGES